MNPKQAIDFLKTLYPTVGVKEPSDDYFKALRNALAIFDEEVISRVFDMKAGYISKFKGWPDVPLILSILEEVEDEFKAEKRATNDADYHSVKNTELRAHIATLKAKLPEIRKEHPSAFVDEEMGKIATIPGLDREPTEAEVSAALKLMRYQKLAGIPFQ